MKINKLTIILIGIILLLSCYIIYDKCLVNVNVDTNDDNREVLKIIENIHLNYVDIYLTNTGISYLIPIDIETINKLDVPSNLKSNLTTLSNRSFYYDIFVNGYKIKGFKVELSDKIVSLKKVNIGNLDYVFFLKEDNTVGLFDYQKYYNSLNVEVKDNYKNLKDIQDISDDIILYKNGKSEKIKID